MEVNVIAFASYIHKSISDGHCEALDAHLTQLDAVQEQPQLIDAHVQGLLDPIVAHLAQNLSEQPLRRFSKDLYRIIYHLCKLRGAKVIVKLLPNHVHLLNPVFNALKSQSRSDSDAWHSRFVLFLWLSLIVMAPFDLKSFDEADGQASEGLASRVLSLAQEYLGASSREREAAGLLIARTITRKDVSSAFIPDYLERCLLAWSSDECTIHFRIGFLVSLCEIFRIGNRDILQAHVRPALNALKEIESTEDFDNNTLLRKLRMKLCQRLALTLLKPSRASWRYKNEPKSYGVISLDLDNEEESDDPSVEVEEVVGVLLEGTQDRDTVVRYSAAKGIGRVASRLPQDFAEEIVGAVQGLMESQTHTDSGQVKLEENAKDTTWQGCCLTIAELCRHGALLPDALHRAMPMVILALQFDIRKGSHSIGTVVRDAACYLLWSVLRCYTSQVLKPLAHQIATTLIVVTLFDREISVRRAASAAYQEGVGRHAEGLFPDGIAVLTLADFQSVGQRQNAFMRVAPQIFAKEAYQQAILDYIVSTSLRHWDRDMRELVSQTLAILYELSHAKVEAQLPTLERYKDSLDVNARHGAFFAAGELCRVGEPECTMQLSKFGHSLPSYALRGVSAALIGHAFSHFVRYTACLNLSEALSTEYYEQVLAYLKVSDISTRQEAGLAIRALTRNQALLLQFEAFAARSLAPSNSPLTKGVIQTIGVLDYSQAPHILRKSVQLLVPLTKATGNKLTDDPEARQLSITSIGQLSKQWLEAGFPAASVLEPIRFCLHDYAVDARGDVGSWVRLGAIRACLDILPILPKDQMVIDVQALYSGLLQQCLSKIDNVSSTAVRTIKELVPFMPIDMDSVSVVIGKASEAFEAGASALRMPFLFTELLHDPIFGAAILRELSILAGSGGHPWAQAAQKALVDQFERCSIDRLEKSFDNLLAHIKAHNQDERVLVPILETLSLLFEYQVPERLIDGSYNFDRLFEFVQESCLRSRHVPKVASSMRIYRGLITLLPEAEYVRRRCWKKLCLLLKHTVPRVRWLAAEQLFIILSETEMMQKNDSTASVKVDYSAVMSALMHTEWTVDGNTTLVCKQILEYAI